MLKRLELAGALLAASNALFGLTDTVTSRSGAGSQGPAHPDTNTSSVPPATRSARPVQAAAFLYNALQLP